MYHCGFALQQAVETPREKELHLEVNNRQKEGFCFEKPA